MATRRSQLQCSPARQHHRLGAHIRLPRNARNVGEVCAPLPAVQAVFPELTNLDALQQGDREAGRQTSDEQVSSEPGWF
jgi:hypothetical protein